LTEAVVGEVIVPNEPQRPDWIKPLNEKPKWLNILAYGDPGAGKTVLGASAENDPRTSPILFCDVEGGTLSISDRGIDTVRMAAFPAWQHIYDYLKNGTHPYKTVVFDSLTEIQKLSMRDIMRTAALTNPARDGDMPQIGEWGKNIEQIRTFVRAFRDLPMNVVFTALAMDVKDESSGAIATKPSLSGKLADETAGFMDMVIRMYTRPNPEKNEDGSEKPEIHVAQFRPVGRYIAKLRMPEPVAARFPVAMDNPSITDIMDLVHGKNVTPVVEEPKKEEPAAPTLVAAATAPMATSLMGGNS